MTSYLATIRIEAFGLAEAKLQAQEMARMNPLGEVVTVEQKAFPVLGSDEGGPVELHHGVSVCSPAVTEAIEAAKSELRAEADITFRSLMGTKVAVGNLRAKVAEALDRPSDALVERVAKRLAERRLLG